MVRLASGPGPKRVLFHPNIPAWHNYAVPVHNNSARAGF
jgi:hypothetical protein